MKKKKLELKSSSCNALAPPPLQATVDLLLLRGADAGAKNKAEETPAALADDKDLKEVLRTLAKRQKSGTGSVHYTEDLRKKVLMSGLPEVKDQERASKSCKEGAEVDHFSEAELKPCIRHLEKPIGEDCFEVITLDDEDTDDDISVDDLEEDEPDSQHFEIDSTDTQEGNGIEDKPIIGSSLGTYFDIEGKSCQTIKSPVSSKTKSVEKVVKNSVEVITLDDTEDDISLDDTMDISEVDSSTPYGFTGEDKVDLKHSDIDHNKVLGLEKNDWEAKQKRTTRSNHVAKKLCLYKQSLARSKQKSSKYESYRSQKPLMFSGLRTDRRIGHPHVTLATLNTVGRAMEKKVVVKVKNIGVKLHRVEVLLGNIGEKVKKWKLSL